MSTLTLTRVVDDLLDRFIDTSKPGPPVDWLIPGVAARGRLTLLSGRGGVGKTSLCLQFANVVGLRHTFGPPELRDYPERVMVYSAERVAGLHTLAHNVMHIGPESVKVFDGRGMNLAEDEGRDLLEVQLVLTRANFLVLDSLRQFAPGKSENSSDDMAPYVSGLQQIAERTGCAIVLIHHFNKAGTSTGSVAIGTQADFTLNLDATTTPDVLVLAPGEKWSLTAAPEPMFLRRVVGSVLRYELAGRPASKPVTDGLTTKLLAIAPGRVWTTAELRKHLGLGADDFGRKRLSRTLGPLVEAGELEAVQRGQYRRIEPSCDL
jgi:AAA domain